MFNNIFHDEFSPSSNVGVTEQGKMKAEKDGGGGIYWSILASLLENTPQTVNELARDLEYKTSEIKLALKYLKKRGYIRTMDEKSGLGGY